MDASSCDASVRELRSNRSSIGHFEIDVNSTLTRYNLDYPSRFESTHPDSYDPSSRFYARRRPRTLPLPDLLPYHIEPVCDRARFLGHIVAHLYIAIKSLDLSGKYAVSAKDLATLRVSADPDVLKASPAEIMKATRLRSLQEDDPMGDANSDGSDSEDEDDSDDDSDENDNDNDNGVELDDNDTTNQHKADAQLACTVTVRTWTRELLVWFKIKYDMPVTLRVALARVYYAICLSRGQYVSTKTYVRMFEILTKDTRLMRDAGLSLPWEGLCLEFQQHLSKANIAHIPAEMKDQKHLLRLATRASLFFQPQALPLIFERLTCRVDNSNAAVVMSLLALMPLPFQQSPQDPLDIRHYVPALFYIWAKESRATGIGAQVTSRLGAIAMAALAHMNESNEMMELGPFGIFSSSQIDFLVNTLMNSLGIMTEKYASSTTRFFHGYAAALVYSIYSDDDIMRHLRTLMNALESYVHPSNLGEWLHPISKWVRSLAYQYHKRYVSETTEYGSLYDLTAALKLSSTATDNFVAILLPFIRIGVHSKNPQVALDYIASLKLLAYLRPDTVLDLVLLDMYESLEGVISTHRVTVALRSLEVLARYFAATPVFRVHIARLLLAAVPGIDSNDLAKTVYALHAFASVAAYVPICDMSDDNGDASLAMNFSQAHIDYLAARTYFPSETGPQFEYLADDELAALKSSSCAFKSIIKSFGSRVLQVLENLPDLSTSEGIEKSLSSLLPKFVHVIIESLSDDIFVSFRDDVFDFVFNNTLHDSIADTMAEICGCLVKRDPTIFAQYCPIFIDKIREEIEENGAGKSRTGTETVPRDQALIWNLCIFNKCAGNAGPAVLGRSTELLEISFFLMENVRGPAMFASSDLVNQILKTVTEIRLKENRLIPPIYEAKYGIDERCWGAFQFNTTGNSIEKLQFSWFVPNREHVSFAVDFFHRIITRAMQNISSFMSTNKADVRENGNSLYTTDGIRVNLLYMGDALAGVSYLMDPSFEHYSSKAKRISARAPLSEGDEGGIMMHDTSDWDLIMHELSHEGVGAELGSVAAVQTDLSTIADNCESSCLATEPCTRVGTPALEGDDLSSVSPDVTSRDRNIYTSSYFFGDDLQQRNADPLYVRLHRTRQIMGKSLHMIFEYLTKHFNENTRVMRHVLYVMNIWLVDMGKERVLDSSHAKIHYSYVSSMMQINRVRKPMTRIAIGARLEAYHMLRVGLHATSRSPSRIDKLIIQDVAKMGFSAYADLSVRVHGLLPEVLKRINGLLSCVVAETIKNFELALDLNDSSALENGLEIFAIKKIENKLVGEMMNIPKLFNLLYRTVQFENSEVQSLAQELLELYFTSVGIPSNVCFMDESSMDVIRPCGENIDDEICDLKRCVHQKYEYFCDQFEILQEYALSKMDVATHWKIRLLTVNLLINVLAEFELPLRPDAFRALAREASSDHPVLSRQALEGISRLVHKCTTLRNSEFKIENLYDLSYVPLDLVKVNTQLPDGKSYYEEWLKQRESPNPEYFIDRSGTPGWLFWGQEMVAASPNLLCTLPFSDSQTSALTALGGCISKEWFKNIVSLWIGEGELSFALQLTDLFVVATLVILVSNNLTTTFLFQDMLEVVNEIYDREDKFSHLAASEIIAGILVGSRNLDPQLAKTRDDAICKFLQNVFENDISPDNKLVWNVFGWFVSAQGDWQRYPRVLECFTNIDINDDSDYALKEATRLSYLQSILAIASANTPLRNKIQSLCTSNYHHRYEDVRLQVGPLEAIMLVAYDGEWVASSTQFLERTWSQSGLTLYVPEIPAFEGWQRIYKELAQLHDEIKDLSPQEALKSNYFRAATTFLGFLRRILNTSMANLFGKYVSSHLVPFLLDLIGMKEVCQLGSIDPATVFKQVSQIPFLAKDCAAVVDMLEKYASMDLSVLKMVILGEFTETFYFCNLFSMTSDERQRIIALTSTLIFHSNSEIRVSESLTLSGLIHISPPDEVEQLVSKYTRQYMSHIDKIRRKFRKSGLKNLDAKSLAEIHGAALGLGAFIHAFAFTSPPPAWIPPLLAGLANKCSGVPGLVGKTAKETLTRFKKNRQDSWHVDSRSFTSEQMQDLEGVLWKSYII